jgi:ABC-type sugar transport system ATPase subunit
VAGLVGAGRSELLGAIFGARDRSTGTVSVSGQPVRGTSPRASIRQGIGFVPPDRKEQGVILGVGIRDNALMVATCDDGRLRRPRSDERVARFRAVAKSVNLRYGSEKRLVSTLSGGNQQKVALSKWLIETPKVLILDEPTRGVDVRAKDDIHDLLRGLAAQGTALLISSSDNEELLALCNRMIVMSRGAVVATVDRCDVDEAQLTNLAGGHS